MYSYLCVIICAVFSFPTRIILFVALRRLLEPMASVQSPWHSWWHISGLAKAQMYFFLLQAPFHAVVSAGYLVSLHRLLPPDQWPETNLVISYWSQQSRDKRQNVLLIYLKALPKFFPSLENGVQNHCLALRFSLLVSRSMHLECLWWTYGCKISPLP